MSVRLKYTSKAYFVLLFCCIVVSSQAQKKGILDSMVRIDVSDVRISTALNRIYYLKSNQKVDIATGDLKFDKKITLADTAKLKDILAQLLYRESFDPIYVDSLNVISIDTAYNLVEKTVIRKDTVKIEVPKIVSLYRDSLPLQLSVYFPIMKTQKENLKSPFGFSLVYKGGKNFFSKSKTWDLHWGISYSAYFLEQTQTTEFYKTYVKAYRSVPSVQVVTENGQTVVYNYETKVPIMDSTKGTVKYNSYTLCHLVQIGLYNQYKFAKSFSINASFTAGKAFGTPEFNGVVGTSLGLGYENKKRFKGLGFALGCQLSLLLPRTLFVNPALSIGIKYRF